LGAGIGRFSLKTGFVGLFRFHKNSRAYFNHEAFPIY
jgi:hypothetical protein